MPASPPLGAVSVASTPSQREILQPVNLYNLGKPISLRTERIKQHNETKRQIARNKCIRILGHEELAKAEEEEEVEINFKCFI